MQVNTGSQTGVPPKMAVLYCAAFSSLLLLGATMAMDHLFETDASFTALFLFSHCES